jgi:hypothetical protein
MGVLCLKAIDDTFPDHFEQWISNRVHPRADYSDSIPRSLSYLFDAGLPAREEALAAQEEEQL